jgi:hypothetical protein
LADYPRLATIGSRMQISIEGSFIAR